MPHLSADPLWRESRAGTRDLSGNVALVIGGSRDQGAACAESLAARGATTVISYADGEHAVARALAMLERYGVRAEAIRSDAVRSCDVATLFQGVVARHGHLDIVVHAVGETLHKPLVQHTDADFDLLIDHNTRSAFNTLRAAAIHLADNGRYIAITGALAAVPFGLYAASQAAVERLVTGAAEEFAWRDITVNVVAPGPVSDTTRPGSDIPAPRGRSARSRLGQPEDVARVVSWLAGAAASWVSGQVIRVDGGTS